MNYEFLQHGTIAMIIDDQGRDHVIDLLSIDYYIAEGKHTVKVEGLETYFTEYLDSTVHCYVSPKGAVSFDEHTDPVDVEIKCIAGTKTIAVNGIEHAIAQGQSLMIPKHTPHRATNKHSSTMLSIGYQ
jgi:mannose-6-phosphate isomerase-like protein (cupin superfamily)